MLYLIKRIIRYYKQYGLMDTSKQLVFKLKQKLFQNRAILFYNDLNNYNETSVDLPENLAIERKTNASEISERELADLISNKSKFIIDGQFEERFPKGAVLWLLKLNDEVAGYRWTSRGEPVQPHFYPLTENDAHLFDGEIFPAHRGKGLNPIFVKYMMTQLKKEGTQRVFIEMREWNEANRRSIKKTTFKNIGIARKFTIFGKKIVIWSQW